MYSDKSDRSLNSRFYTKNIYIHIDYTHNINIEIVVQKKLILEYQKLFTKISKLKMTKIQVTAIAVLCS